RLIRPKGFSERHADAKLRLHLFHLALRLVAPCQAGLNCLLGSRRRRVRVGGAADGPHGGERDKSNQHEAADLESFLGKPNAVEAAEFVEGPLACFFPGRFPEEVLLEKAKIAGLGPQAASFSYEVVGLDLSSNGFFKQLDKRQRTK